jgi:PKD repeat protein
MKGINKKIILSVLLIALIAMPIAGCMRGPVPGNLPPIADFTYSPLTPTTADSIAFTDKSTDDDGNIVTWAWGFGDGNTSAQQNPSHSFGSLGNYTVTLTVTDDGGASDAHSVTITVSAPLAGIGKDDAIAILVSKIIKPADSTDGISAYMLSQPLQNGDVVTSESGNQYPINTNTWFIFIDDEPLAFFAHPARYVFIDAQTGSYNISNETWPPRINNFSMWDTQNLGRGHIIELYSILNSPVPIAGSSSQAPRGDYGDAPDGQDAYYGVLGRYPTLYNTTNSLFNRPGGHILNIGEETLGINVSAEVDATDPNDPDGVPNLVDADSDERIYVIAEGTKAKLAFTVTVSANAPDVPRYVNALIDFDQNGKWSAGTYGTEWVVVNLKVDVAPGSSETVITQWFPWGNQTLLPSPVWMRLLLARGKVDEALFANVGGWDGSGEFEYGEIEDYFAFLMDKPPLPELVRWPPAPKKPPGGDGKRPPPGGGQPPGPPEGPCGYDINYYVITISGGDSCKDLANGTPIVKDSVDNMAGLAGEQGYTSMGNLGPGNNSLSDIGQAFSQLAGSVKCGDYVLIYICGHGKKDGGIALKDASGNTQETLGTKDPAGDDGKDNTLADFLKKIPPCPDEDCEKPACCCHVTVIIESCYAGNFNTPGVTGQGRTVVGTSSNTPSWATYPGGGVYTQGFDKDSRDSTSDTNQDGNVDPAEADKTAKDAVNTNNSKRGKSQAPWSSSQECECKCPCEPGIGGDKWVWDELFDEWVNETEAEVGQTVRFRLEIENDGECRDIAEPELIDFLPGCLDYADEAIIFYNGVEHGARPPDDINQTVAGLQLTWDLDEIEELAPGESIAIEYDAVASYPGPNVNVLYSSAHCTYDPSVVVTDEDTATVMVVPPEIPPEEVLYVGFEAHAECSFDHLECLGCLVTIFFWAEDISSGDIYPVTNVILRLNGVGVFNSGTISTAYFDHIVEREAGCGETIEIELVAMNLIGLEAIATDSITTPSHPIVK